MASSAIRHVFYRPERQELSIWFRDSGRRYKYFDVPELFFDALTASASQGAFYNRWIKGHFRSEAVEDGKGPRRFRPPVTPETHFLDRS
ncbi:MAG: hypothetical protein JWR75_1971 [Devosia sp.]|nr:hypothetical protein [Devosia sp.]